MIDNYDSFTFNIVQYLSELGAEVCVVRNDELSLQQMRKLSPKQIVISPGPSTPDKAGSSLEVVRAFAGKIPILGICLGHQIIGQAFDGKVVPAQKIMHGKTSVVEHVGQGVFEGLPSPYIVARYHSLVVERSSLPECFDVTAWTQSSSADGLVSEIMGMRHKVLPVHSVQFHPEAIMTEHGHALLKNFLDQTS